MQKKSTFRQRLATVISGTSTKEFVQPLRPDGGMGFDDSSRIKDYISKAEQLSANVGWAAAASDAIAEACAAVQIQLYRKKSDGDREEIKDHELLELLKDPNNIHSGEQIRQLHFSYLNFTGESYELMLKAGQPFVPTPGKLPDSLLILPSHQVQFKLEPLYSQSVVKYGQVEYKLATIIRDINPDPANPYIGRSRIAASAAAIDTDDQMKQWNRRFFANNARPGMVINTNGELSDKSFDRLTQSLDDLHSGTDNAYKNIVIENGDAKPYSLTQSDLDFLASRAFSRDEILAMFRLSPALLGMAENVNKATADAATYINAIINTVPRMRQYINLLNKILVKVYDPTLELDFKNPVPEDVEAKLKQAMELTNKVFTIDEIRALYGLKPLPDNLGDQFYIPTATVTLESVANAEPIEDPNVPDEVDPTVDENGKPIKPVAGKKTLEGVKKKI
ncbi:phage portal protein [Cryobacterium sp. 10S3]|uniref:phage portal protein n=1 Tax=Cryobacterium sp. 10S3 TaxID=3048582 RepID=UPI002B2258C2|nr:phage portal protein [Cryobacterium sp. 10S3]MEB0287220.1 phage portal protein [Cryobacterium sp. 10S3]